MLVTLASIHHQESKKTLLEAPLPPWPSGSSVPGLGVLLGPQAGNCSHETTVPPSSTCPPAPSRVSGLCPSQHRATFGPRPWGLGCHALSTPVPQPVPPSERSVSPTATFLLFSNCYEKLNSTMNTCAHSFRIQNC